MNNAKNNTSLQKELEYARAIRNETDQMLSITNPGQHIVQANLILLGERIFQFLSDNQSIQDLSELKIVSDLVQKHTAAYNRIKRLEIKIRELAIKEKLLQLQLQKQDSCNNTMVHRPSHESYNETKKNVPEPIHQATTNPNTNANTIKDTNPQTQTLTSSTIRTNQFTPNGPFKDTHITKVNM